ncbi:unnamed protein product, partial [Symbiodinium sp. KB8]
MSGGGQHQGGGGSQASAAGGNNAALQLDATIRALEHSHLTSRTLSLADFVLTGPPATLGSDVKLLYAKCSRAGLPQADKVYLLKVCGCIAALLALRAAAERAAGLVFPAEASHAYENELEVAVQAKRCSSAASHAALRSPAVDGALKDFGEALVIVQDSHPANLSQLEAEPSACSLPVFMRTGLCLLEALSFLKAQGVIQPYLQSSHVGITHKGHPVLQNLVGALTCLISAGDTGGAAKLSAPARDVVAAAAAATSGEVPDSAAALARFPPLCMLAPEVLTGVLQSWEGGADQPVD